ncbi:hypothetical protein B0H16DRAFT_1488929 [Mycena metata]|uniref:Uncharacterized protein n=1 Tax=Mycena metata TaxID=1033252 RepID=A0AAD7KKW3_9AGAR|nr:hypothetical protein B0H16DRAFT_1488929 [Mycena metata]
MPTHVVRVQRRPFCPASSTPCGTEWLPFGLEYRPLFPWDSVPPFDTDEREIECSTTLESYLLDFITLPVPTILPLDHPTGLCGLYARRHSLPENTAYEKAMSFKGCVFDIMLDCYRKLSSEAKKRVVFHLDPFPGPNADDMLAYQLVNADILSIDLKSVELKAWMCLFTELNEYIFRWSAFSDELDRRHSQPHKCSYLFKSAAIELKGIFFANSPPLRARDAVSQISTACDLAASDSVSDPAPKNSHLPPLQRLRARDAVSQTSTPSDLALASDSDLAPKNSYLSALHRRSAYALSVD